MEHDLIETWKGYADAITDRLMPDQKPASAEDARAIAVSAALLMVVAAIDDLADEVASDPRHA